MIQCNNITKTYGVGALAEPVLKGINFGVNRGEACLLMGPSGSGKTTLLSIIGCISPASGGELHLNGSPVPVGATQSLAPLRRDLLGFVFQHAQLLPFLSVRDNLALVGCNAGQNEERAASRAMQLLEQVDMTTAATKKPGQLSGGQRQRVAVARALMNSPRIILADEPTAALDWTNGQRIIELLVRAAKETAAALIVVTHDQRLKPWFDRTVEIANGKIE